MSITYRKPGANPPREPLMQINRLKFKSNRSSLLENVETNVLKIDFTRILNELNQVDESILDKLNYFIANLSNYTEQVKLEDGVSTEIDGIQIYIDEDGASLQDLQIDATDKLSGKLSRLFNKVTRLENGE
jgi:hypothetical protein